MPVDEDFVTVAAGGKPQRLPPWLALGLSLARKLGHRVNWAIHVTDDEK